MISWSVVGHQARAIHAADLARNVGATLVMDDGTLGADANHLRAWNVDPHPKAAWVGVMEDDAQPVAGFAEQVDAALATAPADVVSLYLGQGKPRFWQPRIREALAAADKAGACWVTGRRLIHAVAVAMRAELLPDWLAFAPTSDLPADERLSAWCVTRGHTVAYTVPSLVEHADWPTLVTHPDGEPRTIARTAWRTGHRDQWASTTASL